jgi:hypothetical protein
VRRTAEIGEAGAAIDIDIENGMKPFLRGVRLGPAR